MYASIPMLAARGYRFTGLQRVDLFWCESRTNGFDVHYDGQRIASVARSSYTDNRNMKGAGSHGYTVCETAGSICSDQAAVSV